MNQLTLLGDSHLARLNRSDCPPTPIEKLFPKTEIIDLTSGGANSRDGLKTIKTQNIPVNATALIMYGTNDCASWKEIPINEFKENVEAITLSLKEKGCKVILITPPPVNEQIQIPPGRDNRVIAKYAELIKDIANRQSVGIINLFDAIKRSMKSGDPHESDGVHLNIHGKQVFIRLLSATISP